MACLVTLKDVAPGDRVLLDRDLEGTVTYASLDAADEAFDPETGAGIMILQDNGARIFHDLKYLLTDYASVEILCRATEAKPHPEV